MNGSCVRAGSFSPTSWCKGSNSSSSDNNGDSYSTGATRNAHGTPTIKPQQDGSWQDPSYNNPYSSNPYGNPNGQNGTATSSGSGIIMSNNPKTEQQQLSDVNGAPSATIMCIAPASNLYKQVYCNSQCFSEAWKKQRTLWEKTKKVLSNGNGNSNGNSNGSHNNLSSGNSNGSGYSGVQHKPSQSTPTIEGDNGENLPNPPNPLTLNNSSVGQTPTNSHLYQLLPSPPQAVPNLDNEGGPPQATEQPQWIEVCTTYDSFFLPGKGSEGRALCLVACALFNPTDDLIGEKRNMTQQQLQKIELSKDVNNVLLSGEDVIPLNSLDYTPNHVLMSRSYRTDLVLCQPASPPPRVFYPPMLQNPNRMDSNPIPFNPTAFRVITYNLLSEIYATQQMYPYCDFWSLTFAYRFLSLKAEILASNGDLYCLQEVQADYYHSHILPFFTELGFKGNFKQKTRGADSSGDDNGRTDPNKVYDKIDGCAMFWRASKFHMLESVTIEFNDLVRREGLRSGMNARSEEYGLYCKRLQKDNIAQLAVFEVINSDDPSQPGIPNAKNNKATPCLQGNRIVVANTHLYSNAAFPQIKLWQAWQLLQAVQEFTANRGDLPVLIMGDLNSTPDSAVYDIFSEGGVNPGHDDCRENLEGGAVRLLPNNVGQSLNHNLVLGSAYYSIMGEEPVFTNYTRAFRGVLDYMWFTTENRSTGGGNSNNRILVPRRVALMIEEETIRKFGEALPNCVFGSDHIMMISEFSIGNGQQF